jgi:hypothetical protein
MTYPYDPHRPGGAGPAPGPQYGYPPPPNKSRKKLLWVLLGVGGLLIVLVCGGVIGLVYFGANVIEAEIRNQVRDNPVLVKHVGQVESFEVNLTESAAINDDDTFVYHVKGSKGSGVLTVKHITDDNGDEVVQSAELRLPDGKVVKVK